VSIVGTRRVNAPLPLRDVAAGVPPSWWPPAPGWWVVAGVLVLAASAVALWRWRQARRRAAFARIFDAALASAETPIARIAIASELLRRAARRIDPHADRLQGEDWLRFLDAGLPQPLFSHGPGALLADGAFRPGADPVAAQALCELARARYLDWMRRA